MKYLSSVGIDIESGKIDIDIIMTGKPKSLQERLALVMSILARLEEANGGKPVKIEDLYREAEAAGLDRQSVDKAINALLKSGDVYTPRPGFIKRVVV
jgi:replicative DNA helicase Mcm